MYCIVLLMYGRVQEPFFSILGPFRLTLVTIIIACIYIIQQRGFSKEMLGPLLRCKIFKYYASIVSIACIGIPFSAYRSKSFGILLETFIQLNTILLLTLNTYVRTKKHLENIVSAAWISVLVLMIVAIINPIYIEGRVSGAYSLDPNDFALFIIMTCGLFYPGINKQHPVKKYLQYGTLLLAIVVLILTQSRGGMIAAACVFLYEVFSKNFWRAIRLTASGAVALYVSFVFLGPEYLERYETILNYSEDYNNTSQTGRLQIWGRGLDIILDNPLIGVGLGAFIVVDGQLHEGKWLRAHNSFIELAADLGIPAFICFIIMLYYAFKLSRPTSEQDWVGRGIRLALIGYFTGGMFLSWAYHFVPFFFIALAMLNERLHVESTAVTTGKNLTTNPA